MSIIPFANDLYLYTGSTFDGTVVIKDVHGMPFLISEGDVITLYIIKSGKTSSDESIEITLTCENEVMGEYPFKLSSEQTAELNGDYYCSAFISFADGDYYQIVPDTPLKAGIPKGIISYCENKNRIIAQVPRTMTDSDYYPSLNELEAFIARLDSEENERPVLIRRINGKAILLIGNIDTDNITPEELVERIVQIIEFVGADDPFISGFFHIDEIPEQDPYFDSVMESFGNRMIDVEAILKTPVFAKDSETVVSSVAFDLLRQKPTDADILSIIHNEYPERIMQNNTHYNKNGCRAAAKVILKEVFNIG